MTPTVRFIPHLVAVALVVVFGVTTIASYRPSGITNRSAALERLRSALASLDDENLDSAARLVAYRDGLDESESLLRRALCSNPTDTSSIERFATVQWESGVLAGSANAGDVLSLVEIAASRAPRVPEIQANLGSLLYRMGSPTEAAQFMRRAVELAPEITHRVIATMQDAGLEPLSIVRQLPSTPEVLVSLRPELDDAGETNAWIEIAEQLLPEYPGELLWSFTDACLAVKAEDRLIARVERLGALTDRRAETERQFAIGRAQLARKAWGPAASAAANARALRPTDARVLEFAGQLAMTAGDSAQAEEAFRDALRVLAQGGGRRVDRARLYRQHGQALERLARIDEAFDEYRRASEILPDDPWLRERFGDRFSKPFSSIPR